MRNILLAALFLPASACAASFARFDLPGVSTTCGTAIASSGLVAGIGDLPSTTPPKLGKVTPFYWRGRKFTVPAIKVPAGFIYLAGVNRWGTLAGYDLLPSLTTEDFTFHRGMVTQLSLGQPVAISDKGTILAIGQRQKPVQFSFNRVAVLRTPAGAVTELDDGTGNMTPSGMDAAADRVVGYSIGTNGYQAWSWHEGVFSPVVVPAATLLTRPAGVDARGRVYGTYYGGTEAAPVSHGFIQAGGKTRTWDAPGASDTSILGSNESGTITGCFTDGAGTHGFVAEP